MVTQSSEFMLTKSTIVKTNIATLVTIIIMLFTGYIWLDSKFDTIKDEQTTHYNNIDKRLAVIEAEIDDRWRRRDMAALWTAFMKRNPALDVPTLADIGR